MVGTVLDDFSNSPAPGVIVTLCLPGLLQTESEVRVTSDEKGHFSFRKGNLGDTAWKR